VQGFFGTPQADAYLDLLAYLEGQVEDRED
jgi:hypothetical protein